MFWGNWLEIPSLSQSLRSSNNIDYGMKHNIPKISQNRTTANKVAVAQNGLFRVNSL